MQKTDGTFICTIFINQVQSTKSKKTHMFVVNLCLIHRLHPGVLGLSSGYMYRGLVTNGIFDTLLAYGYISIFQVC